IHGIKGESLAAEDPAVKGADQCACVGAMLDQIGTAVLRKPKAAIGCVHGDPTDSAVGHVEKDDGDCPVAIKWDDSAGNVVHDVIVQAMGGASVHLIAVAVEVRTAGERIAREIEAAA